MKKLGFLLFLVLGLTACGDDNNDPAPEQHVTCAISSKNGFLIARPGIPTGLWII